MPANEIHVGDSGTGIEVYLKKQDNTTLDISSSSLKEFTFKKPDNTTVIMSAGFTTDGTDGLLYYTCGASDFDLEGKWKLQTRVILSDGDWKSDIADFQVYSNL